MNCLHCLKVFCAGMVVFVAIDFLWLGVIANQFYKNELGSQARRAGEAMAPNWPAVILVYTLAVLGIIFFVLPKAPDRGVQALLWGATFGIVVYGIYDGTNYGILVNWPLKMAVVDTVWGGVVCGLTAFVLWHIEKWLKP